PEQLVQQVPHRTSARGQQRFLLYDKSHEVVGNDFLEQLALGSEIVGDGPRRDARSLSDIRQGGTLVTKAAEDPQGAVEDLPTSPSRAGYAGGRGTGYAGGSGGVLLASHFLLRLTCHLSPLAVTCALVSAPHPGLGWHRSYCRETGTQRGREHEAHTHLGGR